MSLSLIRCAFHVWCQYYTNNRSNSFVDDGVLHLQPTLTSDLIGDAWCAIV